MPVPVTVLVSENLSFRVGRQKQRQEKQRSTQDKNTLSRYLTVGARPLVQKPSYLSSLRLPSQKAGQ
jgi:hypothetical protein